MTHDNVNHPPHYDSPPYIYGECIDYTRSMSFMQGNAFKYVWRAGIKNPTTFYEDINKAIWYLDTPNIPNIPTNSFPVHRDYPTPRSDILNMIVNGDFVKAISLLNNATPNNLDYPAS